MAGLFGGRWLMTMPFFIPMGLYALVMAMTPGPNNLMLAASGANFGFRRTVPHMAGVAAGYSILLTACVLGLGALLVAAPALRDVLRVVGAAYLLYLAFRISFSVPAVGGDAGPGGKIERRRPLTVLEAGLFQLVNPKGWMAALGGLGSFLPSQIHLGKAVGGSLLAFLFPTLLSVTSWSSLGHLARRYLRTPRSRRAFNLCMSGALLATAALILLT